MKKVTHLQCKVYDVMGRCIDSYHYATTLGLYSEQWKQAETDIILKYGKNWHRFTLIEVFSDNYCKPNQIKDNLTQQGQS